MSPAITLYAGCLAFLAFLDTCGPGLNRSRLTIDSFTTYMLCKGATQCTGHLPFINMQSTCSYFDRPYNLSHQVDWPIDVCQ